MKRGNIVVFLIVTGWLFSVHNLVAQRSITSVTKTTSQARQFEKIEFQIVISGSFVNPYDAKDIALDLVLTSPSAKSIKLPCYYVSGDATSSNWKARFAAREAGLYTFHVEVSKNSTVEVSSSDDTFIASATAEKGFLHVNNIWSFKFDNGQLFRGVGENFGWEPRQSEQGGYKGAYTYNYLLPRLAANGVNFFRTWMSPWNLPLEWKQVTNTTRYTGSEKYFNPGAIIKMDSLVSQCDSLGLYMMLALDYHGALCFNWNLSNYNSANGGPIALPAAFFTNATAKSMYKNRLRYLVARWGYSPSIGAFEFFNEIDNAMYTESNGGLPRIPDADVTSWHDEMSTYLKSIDPYEHLITTSISYREVTGMNALANIDFNQKHIYEDPYVSQIDQNISNGISASGKPYVIGEYGYRYQDDNYTQYGPSYDFDFKQGLWLGLFKPTPILPMSWWWEMFDNKAGMTKYFNSVSEVYKSMMAAAGPAGDLAQPTVSASVGTQKVLAVRAGTKYYVYILNNTSAAVNTDITLSTAKNGNFTVQTFDPAKGDNATYTAKGTFAAASNSITITANSIEPYRERILILSEEGNVVGEQMPYDIAIPIPGKLELENFDKGGEGISYHDLESANTGAQYRLTEGVDIEVCTESGFNVTNTIVGEWLEYTVDVAKAGTYTITARVAAASAENKFRIESNGKSISDKFIVPNTGGLQTWQDVILPSTLLNKGINTLRLTFESSDININYLNFVLLNVGPVVTLSSPVADQQFQAPVTISLQADALDEDGSITKVEFFNGTTLLGQVITSPYSFDWNPSDGLYTLYALATDNGGLAVSSVPVNIIVLKSQTQTPFPDANTPHAVPGKIEGEDVDDGADGVAYHDLTPGNIKGQYRPTGTDVDIETCTDIGGGYNLADIQAGEWVEYTVDVAETAKYNFFFRVATQAASQSFAMMIDNVAVLNSVNVPNTGGWQIWQTIESTNITMTAGQHVIKLAFASEFFNLNYVDIEKANTITGIENENINASTVYPNPSREYFSLKLKPTATSVRLMNAQGETIYINDNILSLDFTIDKKLSSGLYVFIIKHKTGSDEIIKGIIIQ